MSIVVQKSGSNFISTPKRKLFLIFILIFMGHSLVVPLHSSNIDTRNANKGKSISKMLLHKKITLNVKGLALNKDNDFSEQELRHIGLLNMIKYKRWDLLPFIGEGFFSFTAKDRQKILDLFVTLQDKLKLHFPKWENFILNLPEYKLSEKNVLTIFAIIKESLSQKCSSFIFPYIAHPKSKIRIPAYKTLAVLKDDRSFPEILRITSEASECTEVKRPL